jgi:hypothetical protein
MRPTGRKSTAIWLLLVVALVLLQLQLQLLKKAGPLTLGALFDNPAFVA